MTDKRTKQYNIRESVYWLTLFDFLNENVYNYNITTIMTLL